MDQFGRYTFKLAFGALLLILLSLTAVVWLGTALKQLKLMTAQGQDILVFVQITLLALPNLMTLIAPVALLIAVIHTLNRLNMDSELIVMTASGATTWRLGRPLLWLAVVMSVWTAGMNFYVMPWSLRTLKNLIVEVRTDLISQVLQPGLFATPEPKLTFHIKGRELNGDLTGLLMNDDRDPKQSLTYIADRGTIVRNDDGAFLVMFDGHIMRRERKSNGSQIIEFERYLIDIAKMSPKTVTINYKPREQYLGGLLKPDKTNPLYKREPGKFRSELHERFSGPLYPLVFVLVALARLGQAQTTRQSRARVVAEAFVFAALLRVGGLAAANLVTLSASAVPLMYAIPLLGIVVSCIVIQRRMVPRRPSRLQTVLEHKIRDGQARIGQKVSGLIRRSDGVSRDVGGGDAT